MSMTDSDLQDRIETARRASLNWLAGMQAPLERRGVMRISAYHDVALWPGMLLPGTYNGVMCLDLLGGLGEHSAAEKAALVSWIEQRRTPDGRFRIEGMRDGKVFKKPDRDETWRYIDWHVTNYALGAIRALNPERTPKLDFILPYLEPSALAAWLRARDLDDPWQEGNNIVNLAGFLLLLGEREIAERAGVEAAIEQLVQWHLPLQEPRTGFWGNGQFEDETGLLHAFAGSMHNFHIWYATARPLPHQDKAIDYVLGREPAIHSACIDVDAIDLLVHGLAMTGHRRGEIEAWCRILLGELLDFQNENGGFADMPAGTWRQDGWIDGYAEPQGVSNTFATWFRWIAIAMIADVLWPGRWPWRFRRMIGIGYRVAAWRRQP